MSRLTAAQSESLPSSTWTDAPATSLKSAHPASRGFSTFSNRAMSTLSSTSSIQPSSMPLPRLPNLAHTSLPRAVRATLHAPPSARHRTITLRSATHQTQTEPSRAVGTTTTFVTPLALDALRPEEEILLITVAEASGRVLADACVNADMLATSATVYLPIGSCTVALTGIEIEGDAGDRLNFRLVTRSVLNGRSGWGSRQVPLELTVLYGGAPVYRSGGGAKSGNEISAPAWAAARTSNAGIVTFVATWAGRGGVREVGRVGFWLADLLEKGRDGIRVPLLAPGAGFVGLKVAGNVVSADLYCWVRGGEEGVREISKFGCAEEGVAEVDEEIFAGDDGKMLRKRRRNILTGRTGGLRKGRSMINRALGWEPRTTLLV